MLLQTSGTSSRLQGISTARRCSIANVDRLHSSRRMRSQRQRTVAVRAERNGNGGGFLTGFVVGGAIFGALGFLFAPQISAALLSEDQRLKLPKFLDEEEKDPEATKQDLADKIASLNAAIDDVSAQLKAQDSVTEPAASSAVPS
ncbi:g1874 [Coccomyxa elongata]